MMAQAAGKCLDAERKPHGKAMLGKIKSASFHQWMGPDQTAIIHAEILNNRDKYANAKCSVEIEGRKICTAELFFVFVSMDQLAEGYRDEVLESFLSK
jgi:3-hydroxymyristoyl/3-hydroxydecanoyl-(acyl carrier protein) dehydratase